MKPPRTDHVFLIIPFAIFIFACASIFKFAKDDYADPTEAVSIAGINTIRLHTNTPKPSETAPPTRTPFPSFTDEPQKITDTPVIVLISLTPEPPPELTKAIIIIPTSTKPEPTVTKQPTQTSTPEPPLWLQVRNNNIRNQMKIDDLKVNVVIFLLSNPMLFMYALIILCAILWAIPGSWRALIIEMQQAKSKTETAEQIIQAKSPVPGVTAQEFEDIRLMIAQGYNQTEMEEFISEGRGKKYSGGAVHRHVRNTMRYLKQTTPPPKGYIPPPLSYSGSSSRE